MFRDVIVGIGVKTDVRNSQTSIVWVNTSERSALRPLRRKEEEQANVKRDFQIIDEIKLLLVTI